MDTYWNNVWEKKTTANNNKIDGYDNVEWYDPTNFVNIIIEHMNIKENDTILDIGCGSANFKNIFEKKNIKYTGGDLYPRGKYKDEIIHLDNDNKLNMFNDNSYDYVITWGTLQYVPNDSINNMIINMKRVAKNGVFFGDVRRKNNREHQKHYVHYDNQLFKDMQVTELTLDKEDSDFTCNIHQIF